jgi:hypothetical protein
MLFVHILLGGTFPKRHRANCGVFAIIRKVLILGHHNQSIINFGTMHIILRMTTMLS